MYARPVVLAAGAGVGLRPHLLARVILPCLLEDATLQHTTVGLILTRALGLLGGSVAAEGQLPSTGFVHQALWGGLPGA